MIGEYVEYQGAIFKVLGYAATQDDEGRPFVEISWNPYLAVGQRDVSVLRPALELKPVALDRLTHVKFKKLHPDAALPAYAKPGDAGLDITAVTDAEAVTHPVDDAHAYIEYKTGLAVEIPPGYVGLIFPRSSISKTVLTLCNSVGVIDSGYRGEILFRFRVDPGPIMDPSTKSLAKYKKGDRIGQLIIVPYPTMAVGWAEDLSDSARGEGGFGSSGQ